MESLLREEVQSLKTHVHNFNNENTQLLKDNERLREKADLNAVFEQRV